MGRQRFPKNLLCILLVVILAVFIAKLNNKISVSPGTPLLAQSYRLNPYYMIILYSTVFKVSEKTGVFGQKISKNL